MVVCLEQGADLHMAQLTPMPLTVSCSSKIQIGFTFLVPAHLGSPGKRAVKRVCDRDHQVLFVGGSSLFYRAMLCIRGTSRMPVSVSVSVTIRSSTKAAKRRITQTTPHDSPGTLAF